MMIDYAALERQLRNALPGDRPTVSIAYNAHAANQEDPRISYGGCLWEGELAIEQAIELNRVWTLGASTAVGNAERLAGLALADQIACLLGNDDPAVTIEWRALDDELRRLLPNKRIGINLEFNYHYSSGENLNWAYESFQWLDDGAEDQAIETNSVWTIEIYGPGIDPSLLLAAGSLEAVVGFLKGKRDVLLANQKRERSLRMSNRHISEMLLRSQRTPAFTVERKVRRGGRNTVEVVRRGKRPNE
jgi:hypothetical protein